MRLLRMGALFLRCRSQYTLDPQRLKTCHIELIFPRRHFENSCKVIYLYSASGNNYMLNGTLAESKLYKSS